MISVPTLSRVVSSTVKPSAPSLTHFQAVSSPNYLEITVKEEATMKAE